MSLKTSTTMSDKNFVYKFALKTTAAITSGMIFFNPCYAFADKKVNLSPSQISQIVSDDITIRQALVTADFSPEIYDDKCKFQDEIDTYEYDKYVKGTKALFNVCLSKFSYIN